MVDNNTITSLDFDAWLRTVYYPNHQELAVKLADLEGKLNQGMTRLEGEVSLVKTTTKSTNRLVYALFVPLIIELFITVITILK